MWYAYNFVTNTLDLHLLFLLIFFAISLKLTIITRLPAVRSHVGNEGMGAIAAPGKFRAGTVVVDGVAWSATQPAGLPAIPTHPSYIRVSAVAVAHPAVAIDICILTL